MQEGAGAGDIVAKAGSIEQGEQGEAPLFDARAEAMLAETQKAKTDPRQ